MELYQDRDNKTHSFITAASHVRYNSLGHIVDYLLLILIVINSRKIVLKTLLC